MSTPKRPVGTPMLRVEDREIVQGTARYLDDLRLPGAFFVAFVRCPHGHARVRSLSFDRARQVPGFVAAFGPHDLPVFGKPAPPMSRRPGPAETAPSPLTDEPRFCGDRVAVVVAGSRYQAADVAAAVDVGYEELPVVIDGAGAMRDDAPLVHSDVPRNVLAQFHQSVGDVDAAFKQAEVIVRDHFETRRASNASIEPRGAAAQPAGGEGVTVTIWTSTQAPSVVRRSVADALGLPPAQVQVITPRVGGGFGPKGGAYPEEIILAALAQHLQRPVRWEATRREDFLSTHQGHGISTDAELAARSDGTILGLRARLVQDAGAYQAGPPVPPLHAAEHILGAYHMPAADVQVVVVHTNKAELSPLRGGGREQGIFIIERLVDHLARQTGIDPIEVRRRNMISAGEMPYDTHYPMPFGGNLIYDSGDYPGLLEEARRLIGYDEFRRSQPAERQAGKCRGIGIIVFPESTAFGEEGARVEVRDDGSVALTLGSPDTGQSHATTMTQICAAELGVAPERITFESGNTTSMPTGSGTFASRFAVMGGNATAEAARQVHQRALVVAGSMLDQTPEGLEIKDGVVLVKKNPDKSVKLGELVSKAREMGTPLDVTYVFAPREATTFTSGAFAAVVDVDIETGCVSVEKVVAVHDSGKVINPAVTAGQIEGGVVMGLGEALGEMMAYDDHGRLLSDTFRTYAVPRAEMIPRITVKDREIYSPNNPEGIKGAGESGVVGTLPMIAAAVEDALSPLDVRVNQLPIRAEDLARICAPLRSGMAVQGGE